MTTATQKKTIRVAIYTRKSTDEGLDQEFNSLDAQRQAVEAYIESQRGEGWVALEDRYDDGGFTGANTDRPAFQRLLKNIADGEIDVVACYKIDRLSRSLIDFVRVMDAFDRHGVTFVSVTQQFNTTTSMGELMLNILMSFAQFERQTIAERTRDKMAATRRRGLWTGGPVPLGYDLVEKKLVVNEQEARKVRTIFKLYLDLGSLQRVCQELTRRRWSMKSWTMKSGDVRRGKPFTKQGLRNFLTNAVYVGKVKLKGELFDGVHERIIDRKTWEAVQHQLRVNGERSRSGTAGRSKALLHGLVRCAVCGWPMTTHSCRKGQRKFRYYVCTKYQKESAAACPGSRISVAELEASVVDQIRKIGKDRRLLRETVQAASKELARRRPGLAEELKDLEREEADLDREKQNLVDAICEGGAGVDSLRTRLGDIEVEHQQVSGRIREIRGELAAFESQVINERDLRKALESFDPVWDQLFPAEKARILQLLVEQVTFDSQQGEISITFRPCGIRTLASESERESA